MELTEIIRNVVQDTLMNYSSLSMAECIEMAKLVAEELNKK